MKLYKEEEGSITIVALLVLVVLTILGITLTRSTTLDLRIGTNELVRSYLGGHSSPFRVVLGGQSFPRRKPCDNAQKRQSAFETPGRAAMRKCLLLAFVILSMLSLGPIQGKIYRNSIDYIELIEPPLKYADINAVWEMLKEETGAPRDVPPPPLVLDWEVPRKARMGFQYPTAEYPNYPLMIGIAPRTIDTWPHELVTYGIGHELLHYLFLLRDNDFDVDARVFEQDSPHHCNSEFMKVSRRIADRIWDMYHSTAYRTQMYDEVTKSCFNQPGQ